MPYRRYTFQYDTHFRIINLTTLVLYFQITIKDSIYPNEIQAKSKFDFPSQCDTNMNIKKPIINDYNTLLIIVRLACNNRGT